MSHALSQRDSAWLDTAKTLDVREVARRLGLTVSQDRFGPCPACGASSRKDEDRLPLHAIRKFGNRGWACNACHVWGDPISLASWVLLDCAAKDSGARFVEVREWFTGESQADIAVAEAEEREVVRVPVEELRGVLEASTPLHKSMGAAGAWARRRGLTGTVPARVLPGPTWGGWGRLSKIAQDRDGRWWPWWSRAWAAQFPVVVPAYTGLGELAGLHGRAVDPEQEAKRKTTWARGCSAQGLVFADPWRGLGALRGSWAGVEALVFVEGFTDYLTAAMQGREAGFAVLGVESGSASAVALLRGLPTSVRLFVGTHNDRAGNRYAENIMKQLATTQGRADVYRLPLWKVSA